MPISLKKEGGGIFLGVVGYLISSQRRIDIPECVFPAFDF